LVFDKTKILARNPSLLRELKRKSKKKGTSPSSYDTMPYYFPTEQVDIIRKIKSKRQKNKK